jgi:hypothetical protein
MSENYKKFLLVQFNLFMDYFKKNQSIYGENSEYYSYFEIKWNKGTEESPSFKTIVKGLKKYISNNNDLQLFNKILEYGFLKFKFIKEKYSNNIDDLITILELLLNPIKDDFINKKLLKKEEKNYYAYRIFVCYIYKISTFQFLNEIKAMYHLITLIKDAYKHINKTEIPKSENLKNNRFMSFKELKKVNIIEHIISVYFNKKYDSNNLVNFIKVYLSKESEYSPLGIRIQYPRNKEEKRQYGRIFDGLEVQWGKENYKHSQTFNVSNREKFEYLFYNWDDAMKIVNNLDSIEDKKKPNKKKNPYSKELVERVLKPLYEYLKYITINDYENYNNSDENYTKIYCIKFKNFIDGLLNDDITYFERAYRLYNFLLENEPKHMFKTKENKNGTLLTPLYYLYSYMNKENEENEEHKEYEEYESNNGTYVNTLKNNNNKLKKSKKVKKGKTNAEKIINEYESMSKPLYMKSKK